MNAGELDREVVIVKRVAGARDAGGHPTISWNDLAPIWAKRTDVSDGERLRAQGLGATLNARFLVRVEDAGAINAQDRIRDVAANETFDLVGVKRLGVDGLELTAARAADG